MSRKLDVATRHESRACNLLPRECCTHRLALPRDRSIRRFDPQSTDLLDIDAGSKVYIVEFCAHFALPRATLSSARDVSLNITSANVFPEDDSRLTRSFCERRRDSACIFENVDDLETRDCVGRAYFRKRALDRAWSAKITIIRMLRQTRIRDRRRSRCSKRFNYGDDDDDNDDDDDVSLVARVRARGERVSRARSCRCVARVRFERTIRAPSPVLGLARYAASRSVQCAGGYCRPQMSERCVLPRESGLVSRVRHN